MTDTNAATPRPWQTDGHFIFTRTTATRHIARMQGSDGTPENAALIVRAVNSHDALLEAIEAVAFEVCGGNRLFCRRCARPRDEHKPETCEVAAALALAAPEGK